MDSAWFKFVNTELGVKIISQYIDCSLYKYFSLLNKILSFSHAFTLVVYMPIWVRPLLNLHLNERIKICECNIINFVNATLELIGHFLLALNVAIKFVHSALWFRKLLIYFRHMCTLDVDYRLGIKCVNNKRNLKKRYMK